MKKILQLSIIFLMGILANGQTPSLTWVKQFGGDTSNIATSVAVDASGNVYTTGSFYSTVDFDPGVGVYNLTSVGQSDIFISKLDASGNFVWAMKFGGSSYTDYGFSITVDAIGNVYITGTFIGNIDFDPGAGVTNLAAYGNYGVFVLKLNSSGNFVWAKSFGGSVVLSGTFGRSIAVDGFGNVYITGEFNGTSDFDPSLIATTNLTAGGQVGRYDIFVSKFDISGNFVWAKSMGGSYDDFPKSVTVDVSGNVYTTGSFALSADFDPNDGFAFLNSSGRDAFVCKLDAMGNYLWAKNFTSNSFSSATSIKVDAMGNVYTSGEFRGTTNFNPSGTNFTIISQAGLSDIFISKFDMSGSFLWAKSMGGTTNDISNAITLDASGNIYTTGNFQGTAIDFDPNEGISNLDSTYGAIFISKLDNTGNFVWARNMGSGSTVESGNSVIVDLSNNIYSTGYFAYTSDFDPNAGVFNLTPFGPTPSVNNSYVHKMTQTTLTINENSYLQNFKIYPNPSNGNFNIVIDENLTGSNVTIYNLLGQIVKDFTLDATTTNYNLNKGVYLIEIEKNGDKTSKKLLIN